jgi:hypothetical protein
VREGGYGATECSFLAADAGTRMFDEGLGAITELVKMKRHEPAIAKAVVEKPAAASPEAKAARILKLAREMKKRGMGDWNVRNALARVTREYPDTKAASEARAMLERMK